MGNSTQRQLDHIQQQIEDTQKLLEIIKQLSLMNKKIISAYHELINILCNSNTLELRVKQLKSKFVNDTMEMLSLINKNIINIDRNLTNIRCRSNASELRVEQLKSRLVKLKMEISALMNYYEEDTPMITTHELVEEVVIN